MKTVFTLLVIVGLAAMASFALAAPPSISASSALQDVTSTATRAGGSGEKVAKIVLLGTDNTHPRGTIFIMDPDGSNRIALLNPTTVIQQPAFSPDGQYVAFLSASASVESCVGSLAGSAWDVMVVGTDRSNPHKVTSRPSVCDPGSFNWLGDSSGLIFSSKRAPENGGIGLYRVSLDGRGEEKIKLDGLEEPQSASPGFQLQPNGRNIVTMGTLKDSTNVTFVMIDLNTGGAKPTSLSTSDRWSSDGQHLLSHDRNNLSVRDTSGKDPKKLIDESAKLDISAAEWSPDGKQIAVLATENGQNSPSLIVMNADGTGKTTVDLGNKFAIDPLSTISWRMVPSDLIPKSNPTPITTTQKPTATKPPTRTPRPTTTPRPSATPRPTATPKA